MDLLDNTRGSTGFYQSGTFSAHPVTMAAGLATLKQLTPEAYAHINGLGDRLRAGLNDLFARERVAAQAVGTGSLFSIHFSCDPVVDYRSQARTDRAQSSRVFFSLLEQGYYLSQGLTMSALSLSMEPRHIDGLIEAVGRAIALY
jgi:glutamate-1-semialdehyde 2,1-aminomutase